MILKSLISLSLSVALMPQLHGGDRAMVFSSKIEKEQKETLKTDLAYLNNFNFAISADPKTLELLEIDDLNAQSAMNWLYDRVSFVVEDASTDKLKISSRPYYQFPQNDDPIIEKALPRPSNGKQKGVTVMSNLGTGLYYAGKVSREMLTLKVKTGFLSRKKIEVNSPRKGIIQIGEGLFMKRYLINKRDENAGSNRLARMAVFFHEARHSDGRGKSLGFFHAVCPIDHDFSGSYACDRNLNGPYSIGAQMIKEFIKNCDDCSVSEKEQLRLRYLDSMNRVLVNTENIDNSVDLELQTLALEIQTYRMIYEIEIMAGNAKLETYQKIIELEARKKKLATELDAIEFIPSKVWDATPELAIGS